MSSNIEWTDPPTDLLAEWNKVFTVHKKSGLHLDEVCPVCGSRALRRYYQRGKPIDRISNGIRYTSTGALWEWCADCRAYTHSTALVPEWWEDPFPEPPEDLSAYPEAIESAIKSFEKEL